MEKNKIELDILYDFLEKHHSYNRELQLRILRSMIGHLDKKEERLIGLLYAIVNTQRQPKIDKLATFFQELTKNKDYLKSMKSFLFFLAEEERFGFKSIFEGLKSVPGWGKKTAALFVKCIILIHGSKSLTDLRFWDDVILFDEGKDELYLPVDSVIIAIFKQISPNVNWNFDTINHIIKESEFSSEMLIWDDLWFWGFFNQKVVDGQRIFEWNPNKYWVLNETNKDVNVIEEIKNLSHEFNMLMKS